MKPKLREHYPIQTEGAGRICPHGLWTFVTFFDMKGKAIKLGDVP